MQPSHVKSSITMAVTNKSSEHILYTHIQIHIWLPPPMWTGAFLSILIESNLFQSFDRTSTGLDNYAC